MTISSVRISGGFLLLMWLFSACSPLFRQKSREEQSARLILENVRQSPVFDRGFTGFILIDAATGREYCAQNADRYFTPASNTKILTLATCLKVLGDSLTALSIDYDGDFPIARGVADPTFLHPYFAAFQPGFAALRSLKETRPDLIVDHSHWYETRWGPGWSWEDYSEAYAAERSPFPLFGNCFTVKTDSTRFDRFTCTPPCPPSPMIYLSPRLSPDAGLVRSENGDYFMRSDRARGLAGRRIPIRFEAMGGFVKPLLKDTLYGLSISETPFPVLHHPGFSTPVYFDSLFVKNSAQLVVSWPVDTVYRRMMWSSDNFIAEHLLLQCAWRLSDTLRADIAVKHAVSRLFPVSPTPPRWEDGSGLSRYNLITPRYLTSVLRQMYLEQPRGRLFSLFPAGGVNGTITDWYGGESTGPYVWAKTGSMGGVHCLSGYLTDKNGKVLIFSFMHNNFVGGNRAWKAEMQRILKMIYGMDW